MYRMKTKTFHRKAMAYAKTHKIHVGGGNWGKSKKPGVARMESLEAGFAPHHTPNSKPVGLRQSSWELAEKQARRGGRRIMPEMPGLGKRHLTLPAHPGEALEGFKQRSDFGWAEFTKPPWRPISNCAQKNDRISFTNQTNPITVEMAPQHIVLSLVAIDSDCPKAKRPQLVCGRWPSFSEEQDKAVSDRT